MKKITRLQTKTIAGIKTIVMANGTLRSDDSEKPDFVHAFSFSANERYARYMTKKKLKNKLGFRNWAKGMAIERYERGLLRHIDKYFRNKYENGNDEPNEDHLSGIRFNVDGIMHEEETANTLRKP